MWKQTIDPKLEASDSGQIRSIKSGKIRSPWVNSLGYAIISMTNPATGRYRRYRLHRVIWETFMGAIPAGTTIDHIDRCRTNNALTNLRVVRRTTNQRNKSKARGQRASVFIGVGRDSGGYRGRCVFQSADRSTGLHRSSVDAGVARDDVAVELAGPMGASLNFPRRYGLSTPPAHQPIQLKRIRPHFALGMGYLWGSLERAAIDPIWIEVDMLATVELDGQTMIRADDAIDWHQGNMTKFPNHIEACRLWVSYIQRGAL